MGDPIQAIIEEFDLDEGEAKLFRAVAAYLESRESRSKTVSWPREYWGKENWLGFRARMIRLVRENLIVAWGDLDQDPYFRRPKKDGGAGLDQPNQWHRAINQHLIPNKPEGTDDLQFRAFQTRRKGIRYLTLDTWLHCTIRKALQGEQREGPGLLRRLRAKYHATEPCELDRRRYDGPERVEENLQSPVIVIDSGEETASRDELGEEERALLEAAPRELSNEGEGS